MKRIAVWVRLGMCMWAFTFGCSPEKTYEKGGDLKVKAGDGCVYVQWRPWADYFDYPDDISVWILRSENGIDFDLLMDSSGQIPGMFAGVVDTGLDNGRDYWYYLRFVQEPYDESSLTGVSETLVARPQSGLAWPVPPAPTNLQVAEFYPDSLVISWTPPQPNDSTYQIEKKSGDFWIVPRDWIWDDGSLRPPVYLPDARLVLKNPNIEIYGWFRIRIFVGEMLSEPSDSFFVSWPKVRGVAR